jgi:acyl-CoA reductase-like NAD-dependent aldehyde dehydrogenase
MLLKMQRGAQARSISLGQARESQQIWARTGIKLRLALLRRARHRIAATAEEIALTIPCEQPGALHRTVGDTLVSEVLPFSRA